MNVFELFAKLSLDSSEYEQGLADAKESGSSFGSALATSARVGATAIAAVGTAAFVAADQFVDAAGDVAVYGDNIDKMSQKLGISVEAYQEWDAVMQHCGASIESLQPAMKALATQAQTGNEAFQQLGISEEEVASLSQEELFERVIAGLQSMEEGTERTYLATQLLGRGSTELGALLNTSAEETQAMRDRVHELGGVLSEEAVKSAAAFQDQLQDMHTAMDGLKRGMIGEFLPSLTTVMSGLTEIFAGNYDEGINQISEGIDNVITNIAEILPKALDIGAKILESLGRSIVQNLPKIMPALVDVVLSIANMLIKNLPMLIETGLQIIMQIAKGIIEALPELIPTIVDVIVEIVNVLTSNIDMLIDGVIQLVIGIVEALPTIIMALIDALPTIITSIVNGLMDALPQLVEGCIQLVVALVTHLPEIILGLIMAIPSIISAILQAFFPLIGGMGEVFGKALEAIKNVFANVGNWFKEKFEGAKNFASDAFSGIKDKMSEHWENVKAGYALIGDWFKEKFTDAKDKAVNAWNDIKEKFSEIWEKIKSAFNIGEALTWGKDMLDNFIAGIKSKINAVGDAVKSIADKIKSIIGFSEPDDGPLSNFHTFAPDMIDLFTSGILAGKDQIENAMDDVLNAGIKTPILEAQTMTPALATGPNISGTNEGDYDIMKMVADALAEVVVEVNIGTERLDDMISTSIQRTAYRSGGR